MIKIISPEQFKHVPWKNGQGSTTELAINDGGNVDSFKWRLSIASVIKNGVFSDFSGYFRNLVLIEGQGITLEHDQAKTDKLDTLLSIAKFDGTSRTLGLLKSGPIKDFNIMTNKSCTHAVVETYFEQQIVDIPECDLCFIYCLSGQCTLKQQNITLPAGHLLKIQAPKVGTLQIEGQKMIIIQIDTKVKCKPHANTV
ncbi:MAG: HutD family protein [Kordiimonadaceae bacterium]|nr:HutD family protein [Kordiimonadaceae bacterium]MBT6036046.1 HutD family protein [Kordiimonadaceae bacterium]MBT6330520.1 HutD family protein [Kordiimonadaceae bacterium]MBT7583264.1 HutD family protein [Kordiimonadaceae bacterium]